MVLTGFPLVTGHEIQSGRIQEHSRIITSQFKDILRMSVKLVLFQTRSGLPQINGLTRFDNLLIGLCLSNVIRFHRHTSRSYSNNNSLIGTKKTNKLKVLFISWRWKVGTNATDSTRGQNNSYVFPQNSPTPAH